MIDIFLSSSHEEDAVVLFTECDVTTPNAARCIVEIGATAIPEGEYARAMDRGEGVLWVVARPQEAEGLGLLAPRPARPGRQGVRVSVGAVL